MKLLKSFAWKLKSSCCWILNRAYHVPNSLGASWFLKFYSSSTQPLNASEHRQTFSISLAQETSTGPSFQNLQPPFGSGNNLDEIKEDLGISLAEDRSPVESERNQESHLPRPWLGNIRRRCGNFSSMVSLRKLECLKIILTNLESYHLFQFLLKTSSRTLIAGE